MKALKGLKDEEKKMPEIKFEVDDEYYEALRRKQMPLDIDLNDTAKRVIRNYLLMNDETLIAQGIAKMTEMWKESMKQTTQDPKLIKEILDSITKERQQDVIDWVKDKVKKE